MSTNRTKREDFQVKSTTSVVCDLKNNALYFSREPIPTKSKATSDIIGKQICVIPFKRDFLIEYNNLEPAPLEVAESVDMMRILEHGKKIRMVPTRHNSYAVDTNEDLLKVEIMMNSL